MRLLAALVWLPCNWRSAPARRSVRHGRQPAKREYLRQLGIKHVMDSRSLEFADTIRSLTNGEGIDLVLNSLTGQAIPDGLSLLRSGGWFLEIGKNELLSGEQSRRDQSGRSLPRPSIYCRHSHDTPDLMRGLFEDIVRSLADGTFAAIAVSHVCAR